MVIIVIEHDFDATTCQCRSARDRFAHFYHIQLCFGSKNLSTKVRRHVSVNHSLSAVLQCHVVRRHCLNVGTTHDWELRCKPEWSDISIASRIDHQFVFFCLAIGLVFLIHRVLTFLALFQREQPESFICASNRVHFR